MQKFYGISKRVFRSANAESTVIMACIFKNKADVQGIVDFYNEYNNKMQRNDFFAKVEWKAVSLLIAEENLSDYIVFNSAIDFLRDDVIYKALKNQNKLNIQKGITLQNNLHNKHKHIKNNSYPRI